MKKDPVETMRIFGAVRSAISAYQKQHNAGPAEAFALFGDMPIDVAFLLSNPARSADDNLKMGKMVDDLKSRGLDLSHITPVGHKDMH